MKLFFILVAVLIGLWWWKQRGKSKSPQANAASKPSPTPQVTMLKCGVCGVHVPDNEALAGQRGAYCGAEHRRQAEGF